MGVRDGVHHARQIRQNLVQEVGAQGGEVQCHPLLPKGVPLVIIISALREDDSPVRKAMFVGRVGSFDALDALREQYNVLRCVIDAHAEPHRVDEWSRRGGHGGV